MKNVLIFAGILALCYNSAFAGENGKVTPFTGDNLSFQKITVSSTTASTLAAYSNHRGAVTCVNSDASNAVWIGSSTVISASGAYALPIFGQQSIEMLNNAQLYGIAAAGATSVVVYCMTEN